MLISLFTLSVIGRSQGYKSSTRLVLSLRTMCAYHSHHVCLPFAPCVPSLHIMARSRKANLLWSILTMEKRSILMRNGFLIILMKNVFLTQYANHHFHFTPLSCHNKESFLNQNFLSLPSLEFDI